MSPRKGRGEGVPPLRNPDVTGMTKPKQDEVIRESGTTPNREDAAEEFLDEQMEQARETGRPSDRQAAARMSESGGSHPGLTDEERTELETHWDPKTSKARKR